MLVALVVPDHVHHGAARAWFRIGRDFATCPTVQGTLLRLLLRHGARTAEARSALLAVVRHPRHQQWYDDLSYVDVDLSHVLGHRQVTDAYLVQLARARGGRLATFDRGLVHVASDIADLLPH